MLDEIIIFAVVEVSWKSPRFRVQKLRPGEGEAALRCTEARTQAQCLTHRCPHLGMVPQEDPFPSEHRHRGEITHDEECVGSQSRSHLSAVLAGRL